ncbi:MAG: ATP-binding protein [Myxococcaceae bacterium]
MEPSSSRDSLPPVGSFPGPVPTRLAGVAEALADALIAIGREGRVRFANRHAERLFGRSRDELMGMSAELLLPERMRERFFFARDRFFEEPQSRALGLEANAWCLRKDGGEFPVEVSVAPEGPPEDRWAVLVVRDASLHRRVLRAQRFLSDVSGALASSLDYEATLSKVTHMAVPEFADWCLTFIADGGSRARRVELAHADESKAPQVAEVRRLCSALKDGDSGVDRVLRGGRSELYTEPSEALEKAVLYGDAGCREAIRRLGVGSAVLAPLQGHDGPLGVLVLVFGASGRRYGPEDLSVAEELGRRAGLAVDHAFLHREVQATEVRYRRLFEGAQDPIFILDGGAKLVDANPAAVALLGYPRDELLEFRLDDPRLARKPDELRLHLEALQRDGSWRGEVDLLRNYGGEVPLEVRATSVDSPDGGGFVLIAREITERRALEKMQRDFIALVTHELRNPLSVVKGYAQLMQRTRAPNERGLSAVISQVNHMDRLVSDLLEASRIEAGRLELRRTRTDMVALVRACSDQAQAIARLHTVHVVAPEAPVMGEWDRDRLEEVMQNLLTNAIKYSPDGGEILVRVEEKEDGRVLVSVRDEGIGIPVDALPRLFRRFFRVEGSSSVAKGLGLGLYVSRSLIEAHGGHIWAEPGDARGTIFSFAVPKELPGF